MNEFEDQFMGDCGVEGSAGVHVEHPYICVGVLQGGQGCVECDGDSVLWGSVCLMGILVAVQVHREAASDVRQDHPLKAPHDYWGEGDWAVVIEAWNGRICGDRDDGSNNNNNAFYLEKRLSGHSRTLYITHNKTHNEIYKKRDKIDIERTT